MSRTKSPPKKATSDRATLRRRVLAMIRAFNAANWNGCFDLIDPKLRAEGVPQFNRYAEQLAEFHAAYGHITPWHVRLSLHLDTSKNKQDPRPFAFVYVVWKDARSEFHIFRERWV